MRSTVLAATAVLALTASAAHAQSISVPSDARARYEAVSTTKRPDGLVEIITRRQGPSGMSFARREVDCRRRTFRYVGEGDTLEEAKRQGPNPGQMAELVQGSISWHVVQFACRR
jgi:hypothetical protein